MTIPKLPTRHEINMTIKQLIEGSITREEASKWAIYFLSHENMRFDDAPSLKVIMALGGADIYGFDRDYLYGNIDFIEWQRMLDDS